MKHTGKILTLIFFILFIPLTVGIAPDSIQFSLLSNGTTFIHKTQEMPISILAIDSDSNFMNCTAWGDYIDSEGIFQDDQLLEYDYINIFNNTSTSDTIDFGYFQESNDVITYNVTMSCSDGVDETNSSMFTFTIRGFYLYTEGDIARAVISGISKTIIFFGLIIVVIGVILIYIWGKNKVGKLIG